jgi:hypothetical protein
LLSINRYDDVIRLADQHTPPLLALRRESAEARPRPAAFSSAFEL